MSEVQNWVNEMIEDSSINEKMNQIWQALDDLVSWETITPEQRDNFVERWLWEDPTKLNEESNWLIDQYISETIDRLERNTVDAEMIRNISIQNIQDLLEDVQNNDFSFEQSLQERYWQENNEDSETTAPQETETTQEETVEQNELTPHEEYMELSNELLQKIREARELLSSEWKNYEINLELVEWNQTEQNIIVLQNAIDKINQDIQDIQSWEYRSLEEVQNEENAEQILQNAMNFVESNNSRIRQERAQRVEQNANNFVANNDLSNEYDLSHTSDLWENSDLSNSGELWEQQDLSQENELENNSWEVEQETQETQEETTQDIETQAWESREESREILGVNEYNKAENYYSRLGATKVAIEELQWLLMLNWEDFPKYWADGYFGRETFDAIVNFQQKNNLAVDWLAWVQTLNALWISTNTREFYSRNSSSNETRQEEQTNTDNQVETRNNLYNNIDTSK